MARKDQAYKDKMSKQYAIRVYKTKDQDIIDQIEKQPSVGAYIRQLIREDIARHSEDTSGTKKDTE